MKSCKILPNLSEFQMDVLIGSLLGDGHLHKLNNERSNSHFGKSQTTLKKEYLDWHNNIFKEYSSGVYPCWSKSKISCKNNKIIHLKVKRRLSSYAYRTFNHEIITELRNKWYPDGIKIIPSDLSLNSQRIAVWYFDDGSNDTKSRRATICTNSFSLNEVEFLSSILNKFNLFPIIHTRLSRDKKKKEPMLRFSKESYDNLISLVSPHMLWDCFKYKINWRPAKKTWIRNSKITEEQAKEIIQLKKTTSTKIIAEKFNLAAVTINQIISGRKWPNLVRN